MRTNRSRSRHLIAVTRVAAVLVALAAAVTLTSVAAAGPDGAKQRAISQKGVVVKLAVFANFKARLVSSSSDRIPEDAQMQEFRCPFDNGRRT